MYFYVVGLHYWYNLTEDINCDDIFPVYTIYLDGTLVAIGWAFNEQQTSSGRWEDSERAVIGVSVQLCQIVPKFSGMLQIKLIFTQSLYFLGRSVDWN